MLEFFQKYQRIFFLFVAVVVIASFSFFGTFGTFIEEEKQDDRVIGEKVDGSPMLLFELQLLSRFLLANEGILERDLLRTGIADLLVEDSFDVLKEELQGRLDRAKRFRLYSHPKAPYLNASLAWARFFPAMLQEYKAVCDEKEVGLQTFSHLSRLYQQQRAFSPDLLRKCLFAEQKQIESLQPDPNLFYADLSLFGFHTMADWFGPRFVDLAAEFILNGAAMAEKKGYEVSFEEAKGDLLSSLQQLRAAGFDEKSACEAWRKVLLFRRLFDGLGQATFVDRLPYRDFASYALETAVVDFYTWPAPLAKSRPEELEAYLRAISPDNTSLAPPQKFYPMEEVAKRFPELVQATYRAQVAEISKEEVALRASVQQVWDWQLEEANWNLLKQKFSFLSGANSREERFSALEKLDEKQRLKVDRLTRLHLLELHPEWVSEALASLSLSEKTFSIGKASFPHIESPEKLAERFERESSFDYCDDGKTIYHFEQAEKIADRHLLTFEEAKGLLTYEKKAASNRLAAWVQTAYEELRNSERAARRNPGPSGPGRAGYLSGCGKVLAAPYRSGESPSPQEGVLQGEVAAEEDPIAKQFQLVRREREIQRTTKEEWMNDQIFDLSPGEWSPIHMPEQGEISFFFLREKRSHEDPIFEQLHFGKQLLVADTERYLAEQLLQVMKKKKSQGNL